MSTDLVTLTGYLGKDREDRQTKERTRIATYTNEIAEMTEEYEVTVRPRDYLVLSLATHRNGQTTWNRLIVWSPERTGLSHVRLGRKGDLVKVTGRPESFRYTAADGTQREVSQIVVVSYKPLRIKIRHEAP
jgi:single-stranded DNA-binding protein